MDVKGSLTVEAALLLPFFIYTVAFFIYFLQIIFIHEWIQFGLSETGTHMSRMAYVYESFQNNNNNLKAAQSHNNIKVEIDNYSSEDDREHFLVNILDSSIYQLKLLAFLKSVNFDYTSIVNGNHGIDLRLSEFFKEGKDLDIIAIYKIRMPIPMIPVNEIPMLNRVRVRAFAGCSMVGDRGNGDTADSDERIVYITETGSVYHLTKSCTHIRLSVQEVSLSLAADLRNDYGGKYKECEICSMPSKAPDFIVYITNTGDRYHSQLACSGLKRTVLEIPLSQVGGRSRCRRCGG